MWTLSFTREAMQELYSFERGTVAGITSVIVRLQYEPIPQNSIRLDESKDFYRISIAGHSIEYQLIESDRIVKILSLR